MTGKANSPMAETADKNSASQLEAAGQRGSAKAFRRLMWFLVLCYVLSYVDRINIGFANLTMAADLGLTATTFGIASSIFFIAYALFEIPSNLGLARFGARRWIPRIMISWGLFSCLTMFAYDEYSLYVLRFFVGAAEAGLAPGVILYLSYWFRERDRARANGIFILGMPIAMIVAPLISSAILQLDGLLGLHGWQWLFLLEGLPSIVIGVVAYFYLSDGPATARWLTAEERAGMQAALSDEHRAHGVKTSHSFQWSDLANPTFAMLAIAFFCETANNNTIGTWTPLLVKELLGNTNDVMRIGYVSAVVPLLAIVTIPLWSWSSDRFNERKLHLIFALLLVATGWVTITLVDHSVLKLGSLALTATAGYPFIPVFWALAVPLIPPASRPAGIAIISTFGLCASVVTPAIVGVLRDWTHDFNASLWFVASLQVIGIVALLVGLHPRVLARSGFVSARA